MKHILLLLLLISSLYACNMLRKVSWPMVKDIMTPERSIEAGGIQVPPGYWVELFPKA